LAVDAHINRIKVVHPFSGHAIETLRDKLRAYETTKDAIRVPLETPISERALRAVIDCRLEVIRADNVSR